MKGTEDHNLSANLLLKTQFLSVGTKMVFAGLKKKTERAGRVKMITAQSVSVFLKIVKLTLKGLDTA